MKAIKPAMNDPTKTMPMASPAVRPFAKLLEPSDQAEELTAAAILIYVSQISYLRVHNKLTRTRNILSLCNAALQAARE